MHDGLLSGQVFSPLVKIGLRGVTGAAALLPGFMAAADQLRRSMAWALRIGGGSVAYGCMVGFAFCKPADTVVYQFSTVCRL